MYNHPVPTKSFLSLLAVCALISGCRITIQTELPTAIPTIFITATLPPSSTPRPSETPSPPPPTPTVAPVAGVTSTQLNVRAEPSTASEVLGIIPAGITVQIVGQDPGGNWWQILYEAGAGGKGWVTAQYVRTATRPEVPVIGSAEQGAAGSAVVIQQINVRSGPGTGFNSLGLLNANDVIRLTGKNRDGSWLQIEFAGGPDGKGWVNAAFVRAQDVDTLPIVAETGEIVRTGTPANTPLPPTPTVASAPMDFDSADTPLVSVVFEPNGTTALIYSGDVSSPEGDPEDWIGFIPYTTVIYAQIDCTGANPLQVKLTYGDTAVSCNQPLAPVSVTAGILNLVHISADRDSVFLAHTQYTLTLQVSP